jgi:hypothetical protein
MAEGNSLGISTGINKGEAQVFGNTYNPLYKDKLEDAKEKKAELDKGITDFESKGVYWRDEALMKDKLNNYRTFVQDNVKALMDGDFDALSNKRKLESEMSQFATNSKATEAQINAAKKLYNSKPDKYAQESLQSIYALESQPGVWGAPTLEAQYDSKPTVDSVIDFANKQGYTLDKLSEQQLADADFVKNIKRQRDTGIKEYIQTLKDNDLRAYPTQAAEYWTPEREEQLYQSAKGQLDTDRSIRQVSRPSSGDGKTPSDYSPEIQQKSSIPVVTAYSTDEGTTVGADTNVEVYDTFDVPSGRIRMKSDMVKNGAIPVQGSWSKAYLNKKTGEEGVRKFIAEPGQPYDLDMDYSEIIGSDPAEYEVGQTLFAYAFTEDSKGKVNKDKSIGGTLVPPDYKLADNQKKELRFYSLLISEDGNKILVPFKNAQNSYKAKVGNKAYQGVMDALKEIAKKDPERAAAIKRDVLGFSGSSAEVEPVKEEVKKEVTYSRAAIEKLAKEKNTTVDALIKFAESKGNKVIIK